MSNFPNGTTQTPANPPVIRYSGSAEGLVLQVSDVLQVHKRTNPTDDEQTLYINREVDLIIMETEKQNITLTFSLDELRSIMRLFDVPESED